MTKGRFIRSGFSLMYQVNILQLFMAILEIIRPTLVVEPLRVDGALDLVIDRAQDTFWIARNDIRTRCTFTVQAFLHTNHLPAPRGVQLAILGIPSNQLS